MQTCSGYGLVAIHQIFPLAECVEKNGHRANVQRVRAEPQQMIQDPRNFIKHHADILGTHRHCNAHQFFNCHHIRMLIDHHGHIVKTIHVRHTLDEGAGFGEFFCCAMQQADMRIGTLNHFSVQLQHQTKHAVGCRMLRPEIHGVVFDFSHGYLRPA